MVDAGQEPPIDWAAWAKKLNHRFHSGYRQLLGLRVTEAAPQRVVAELPFRPGNLNAEGIFHGGALLSLADIAATACCFAVSGGESLETRTFLTVTLNAHFLGNAREGVVRAVSVPVHAGRRTLVIETRLYSEDGRLLTMVTTTHMVATP